jgi:glycerol-3-phosphate O-acyltransferase
MPASEILGRSIKMGKIKSDTIEGNNIVYIPSNRISLLVYYRNNIYHMLLMPSLVVLIVQKNNGIDDNELLSQIKRLYPMISNSFFLRWELEEIPSLLKLLCAELTTQGLIIEKDGCYYPSLKSIKTILILGNHSLEILQCLSIILLKLKNKKNYDRKYLEINSYRTYQSVVMRQYSCSTGFFDKTVFSRIISSLREEGYINIENGVSEGSVKDTLLLVSKLLTDYKSSH